MSPDLPPRQPGSFYALGQRLLRDAFPAMEPEVVKGYLRRTDARLRRTTAARPIFSPPEIPDPSYFARPVVLVVDDEEDLRDIMRRMLERRGFNTLAAADADEALQLCREHPGAIDIVLTDLALPSLGGHQFAEAAAAFRPNVRTVFMSGLPREIAVAHGLITEDETLMKKPFSAEELIAALRALSEFSTGWTP